MDYGFGLLVLLLCAICIGVVFLTIDYIGKKYLGFYDETEEEDDGYIYYWEI